MQDAVQSRFPHLEDTGNLLGRLFEDALRRIHTKMITVQLYGRKPSTLSIYQKRSNLHGNRELDPGLSIQNFCKPDVGSY